jgi:uncharacterized protein YbcI
MATEEKTQSLPEEIASAVAAVWTRHAAKRPTKLTVEIHGDRVTCVIPNSVNDFERGPEEGQAADLANRQVTYRREAGAAVAKTLGCRVLAVMSERDATTDAATEVFVLDVPVESHAFGTAGWIAR